jgi:hypothetical protein
MEGSGGPPGGGTGGRCVMAGIEDYRTGEEISEMYEEAAYTTQVLSEAIDAGAHLLTAMDLDEPQAVIELWTNKLWNGLRDRLDGEERLTGQVPR